MRRCYRDTAGFLSARAAAKRIPGPHPAEAGAPAPPRSPARATPPQRGSETAARACTPLYGAILVPRPDWRVVGTSRLRAAGRNRDRGRGASTGTGDRGECVTELRGPEALTTPRGASRPPCPFCCLSVELHVSERGRVAERAAENRANSCFREGVARWHYTSHRPHGGNSANLTRCQPELLQCPFLSGTLVSPICGLCLPFLPLPLLN